VSEYVCVCECMRGSPHSHVRHGFVYRVGVLRHVHVHLSICVCLYRHVRVRVGLARAYTCACACTCVCACACACACGNMRLFDGYLWIV
jgi:hypothetical protein